MTPQRVKANILSRLRYLCQIRSDLIGSNETVKLSNTLVENTDTLTQVFWTLINLQILKLLLLYYIYPNYLDLKIYIQFKVRFSGLVN